MRQVLPLAWFLSAITLLALAPSGWAGGVNSLAFVVVASLG